MINTRKIQAIQQAEAEIKKNQKLLIFPKASRISSSIIKIVWGILMGAATIIGILALVPTAHFILLGGIILGAFFWGIKATVESYQKNKEEKRLMKSLGPAIALCMQECVQIDINTLESLIFQLRVGHHHYMQREIETLYAQLTEYLETLDTLSFLVEAKKRNSRAKTTDPHVLRFEQFLALNIKKRLQVCRTTVASHRRGKSTGKPSKAPALDEYRTIAKPIDCPKEKSWFKDPKTFFGKLAYRGADFMGGVSSGVAAGIGIMTFIVGASVAGALMSNPLGWAMLGIIAGGLLVGALTVAINYILLRSQQKKIGQLEMTQTNLNNTVVGLKKIHKDIQITKELQQSKRDLQWHKTEVQKYKDTLGNLLQFVQRKVIAVPTEAVHRLNESTNKTNGWRHH